MVYEARRVRNEKKEVTCNFVPIEQKIMQIMRLRAQGIVAETGQARHFVTLLPIAEDAGMQARNGRLER